MTTTSACPRIAEWVVGIAKEGTRGVSMGGADEALYIAFPEGVVAVTTPRIPLMPNGIVLPDTAWPARPVIGCDAILFPGLLRLGGRDIWLKPFATYDSRITHPAPLGELLVRMRGAAEFLDGKDNSVVDGELERLASSLASSNVRETRKTALLLIGRGRGLTPEGDDLLVGAAAACVALGMPGRVLKALVPDDVESRTTALSASLLRHAIAGQVVAPLLNVLSGRGHVTRDIHMLVHIGHSTGRAYLRAASAVVQSVTASRSQRRPMIHEGEE